MKKHLFLQENIKRSIPILEIWVGLIFLIFNLYSIYTYQVMFDDMSDGLKGLISYEAMRYGDMLLWCVCLFTGCIYWSSKKAYWISTQTLLCLFLLKIGLSLLYFQDIPLIPIMIYTLFVCSFLIFIIIEVKLFNVKEIASMPINRKVKLFGVAISVIASYMYWYLEVIYPSL